MPRNIDPEVKTLGPQVHLSAIDDLHEVVDNSMKKRESALQEVEGIIRQKILEFNDKVSKLQENPALIFTKEFQRANNMTNYIVLIAYGLFLILGGFMGLKKGSKVSLIMGSGSGILVLGAAWFLSINPQAAWAFLICLNALLSAAFVSRLIKTRAFMPSGMLLVITLAVLIFCITR